MNKNKEIYGKIWGGGQTQDYKMYSAGNRWYNARFLDLLKKHLKQEDIKAVADIGCGDGSKTWILSRVFPKSKVIGFDFSEEAIQSAGKAYKEDNLTFVVKDILQTMDSNYDLITALEILEHIEDWKSCLQSFITLKPKYFLFSYPTGKMRKNEEKVGHFRHFKMGEVESFMERHGYHALEANYGGFPFYSPIFVSLQYKFMQSYLVLSTKKMSLIEKLVHYVIYILFRYFSFQNSKGDSFIGIFEKKE